MKPAYRMALAGFAGAALGVIGMALAAQNAAPKAYWIANIQEVKDPETYRNYTGIVTATLAPYGGQFIVRGAAPVILDKSPKPPGYIVVIEFPSLKNLRDWWDSETYSKIRPIRERVTVGQGYAAEGVPPS